MKNTIAGSTCILASSIYALAAAVLLINRTDFDQAFVFIYPGIAHFALGLYFLFFARDKPSQK